MKHYRFWLLVGLALVPITYFSYTQLNLPRIRCHTPSFSSGHMLYELTAYIFILISGVFIFRFDILALRENDHVLDNTISLILATLFCIFSFSLVFYTYGIIDSEGIYIAAPDFSSELQTQVLIVDGQERYVDLHVFSDNAGRELPFSALSEMRGLLENSWMYVAYSISNTIPGAEAFEFKPCPSAAPFVLIQNFFGLVLTGFFGLLGARLSKAFQLKG